MPFVQANVASGSVLAVSAEASHRFRMFQAQNNESTTLWSADGRVYVIVHDVMSTGCLV